MPDVKIIPRVVGLIFAVWRASRFLTRLWADEDRKTGLLTSCSAKLSLIPSLPMADCQRLFICLKTRELTTTNGSNRHYRHGILAPLQRARGSSPEGRPGHVSLFINIGGGS